jgi:hypothetical protein
LFLIFYIFSFRSPSLFYLLTVGAEGFLFSLDHTQAHITFGRTPLDEGSARRRDLYLTTQTLYKTNIHAPGGIRTHDSSKRSVADLRLRPRDYWQRLKSTSESKNTLQRLQSYAPRSTLYLFVRKHQSCSTQCLHESNLRVKCDRTVREAAAAAADDDDDSHIPRIVGSKDVSVHYHNPGYTVTSTLWAPDSLHDVMNRVSRPATGRVPSAARH